MIDIHSHILPGLDDGAASLEEAIQMARLAVLDGITDIIATPHTHNGINQNLLNKVLESVRLLQRVIDSKKIPLKIYPGSEVHIHNELINNIRQNKIATLCNAHKYVLIELPSFNIPIFTDKLLEQLLQLEYVPIIAHPERNLVIQENSSVLFNWVKRGIPAQITAGCLLGKWGRSLQRLSRTLIRNNCVQLLASDGHNAHKRPSELHKAYRQLEKWACKNTLQRFQDNAYAVLAGKDLVFLNAKVPNE